MKPLADAYDCVVMGGGPAGSTVAALVAKEGFSVLLVERDRFPRRHVGESLMPDTYFVFQRLGVLDKMKSSGYAKKVGVQFVNDQGRESAPFFFRTHDPRESSETWHIPRPEFDLMMFEHAASCGADCRQGTRVRDVLMDGDRATGVVLQYDQAEAEAEPVAVRAKVVVDATGQQAILSNKLGLRKLNPALKKAAVWGHFRGAAREVEHGGVSTLILHTKGKKCWFWYIPQADDVVSVGVVGDRDYLLKGRGTPDEIFAQEVENCPAMGKRLAGSVQVSPLEVAKEFSYSTDRAAGDSWVLAGDAWGFIDPVYSSGVFFALKSGEYAGDAVIEALRTGETSAATLGRWTAEFGRQTNLIRKLVHAFYDDRFRVGDFVKEFPQHRGELTDLLIGRVFDGRRGAMFDDLEPFLERAMSSPRRPAADDSHDPTLPALA